MTNYVLDPANDIYSAQVLFEFFTRYKGLGIRMVELKVQQHSSANTDLHKPYCQRRSETRFISRISHRTVYDDKIDSTKSAESDLVVAYRISLPPIIISVNIMNQCPIFHSGNAIQCDLLDWVMSILLHFLFYKSVTGGREMR